MTGLRVTGPVIISGHGVVLREWSADDVAVMQELFDDRDVAYRTPLESPFDEAAALRYLHKAQQAMVEGRRIHLAVTLEGGQALGEVLLGLNSSTIGYAIGAAHRGQGLATRAVRVLTEYAHAELAMAEVVLEIEPGNGASAAVARGAGYRLLTDVAAEVVTDKGRTYELLRWEHRVAGAGGVGVDL